MVAVKQKQSLSTTTSHATSSEWRWVIIVSAVMLVVISLPLAWALWVDMSEPDRVFMGLLSNPLDGATYLSKIQVGKEGYWRTIFRHSPGVEQGAYVTLVYNGLGQLTSYLDLSNVLVYHAGRLIASMLMFLALYQFASMIWRRQRARRTFFILSVIGSGLGWLVILFGPQSADLVIPEAFPLYSAATNVHFPLALALLAVAAGFVVVAFRPGFKEDPAIHNGGLSFTLSALGLALIAPHALVPFGIALALLLAIDWIRSRRIHIYQFRWFMLLVLPALPVAGYYLAEVYYNDTVQQWMLQNVTLTPNPFLLLAGFGVPLIIAIPGIVRAVRRFEPDGDQFMLLWLASILVLLYIPTDAQRRFAMGAMIPITYFAVRALTDFWLDDRPETYRGRFVAGVYGVSAISYVLLLLSWFQGAVSLSNPIFYLSTDYERAFEWLDRNAEHGNVVLSSSSVGLWVPSQAGMSVVYGHPYESLQATEREQQVNEWYKATSPDDAICERVLRSYDVRYVLVGPQEYRNQESEVSACVGGLTEERRFGDVTLYIP